MKTADRVAKRDHVARVQRLARERADAQARRIPWRRLLDARNEYIDWQEFQLWVRSILEVENGIPNWLVEILNTSCPGFLESEKRPMPKRTKNRPLPLRLEDWIDDQIFGSAKQEGWFNAITYYAVRDPRYRRAEVCWTDCVEKWKKAKPAQYPTFDEWKTMAAKCDDAAHLTPQQREACASVKLVRSDRLAAAVAQYMDYEALAYWACLALESGSTPPTEVERELELRCPGFLENELKSRPRKSGSDGREWERLMTRVGDQLFHDAKTEGWFDAILAQVRNHPRAIRTMEYADHCDELWGSQMPDPYPALDDWRTEADSYVAVAT